jgi:hypothetical protein
MHTHTYSGLIVDGSDTFISCFNKSMPKDEDSSVSTMDLVVGDFENGFNGKRFEEEESVSTASGTFVYVLTYVCV